MIENALKSARTIHWLLMADSFIAIIFASSLEKSPDKIAQHSAIHAPYCVNVSALAVLPKKHENRWTGSYKETHRKHRFEQ